MERHVLATLSAIALSAGLSCATRDDRAVASIVGTWVRFEGTTTRTITFRADGTYIETYTPAYPGSEGGIVGSYLLDGDMLHLYGASLPLSQVFTERTTYYR